MKRSCLARGLVAALVIACLAMPGMAEELKFSGYPVKTKETLKVWMPLNVNWSSAFRNFGELPFAKELERRTGIKVEYIHPALGQEAQSLALVIASGDLPDIFIYNFATYPGGPEKAVKDGAIMSVNELWARENPNLKKILDANPQVMKLIKTDSGMLYSYPFVRDYTSNPDMTNATTSGPMVRQDWLKELGLKQPETIEDWTLTLRAFKDKKGATAPLTLAANGTRFRDIYANPGFLIGAYVPSMELYQENGVVKFGAAQAGYREFLAQMAAWYKEGLLDNNLFTTDTKLQESNMLTGKSGATFGPGVSMLQKLADLSVEKNPSFDLAGPRYPVLKRGDKPSFAAYTAQAQTVASISAKTKNPALAARWLDYAYSEAGHELYVFGVEGQSYTLVNGKPRLTELVKNNPEGLSLSQAISRYSMAWIPWPYQNDVGYLEQTYDASPKAKAAVKNWAYHDAAKRVLFGLSPTPEEASKTSKLTTSLRAYIDEMTAKFILGVEPLDKFPQFQAELVKLGVNDLVALTQDQLDRFNKR